MKIINDKGKVFGIINIIDLTVLLFIISTITGISWLIYTGELFKDHDPAKITFQKKKVELFIDNQTENTIKQLSKIKLPEKISDNIQLDNTKIERTNEQINILTNTKNTSINSYNITFWLDLKTQTDFYTKTIYVYDGIKPMPLEENQHFFLTWKNNTFNTTIISIK